MKKVWYTAVALVLGAILAEVLLDDPGHVAISLQGWLVDMSVPVFVLLLLTLYGTVRLGVRLLQARRLLKEAQTARRRDRARSSLFKGLLELSQGDWRTAEETVTRSARDSEYPLVHYLVAARAADLQGERSRCEELLTKALDATAGERAPVLITQAEILLRHKQPQAALTVLQQLEASGERNTRALMLLARIYRQTGDWERLQHLEPRLRSARGVPEAAIDEIVVQIYLDRLKAAGSSGAFAQVGAAWEAAPTSVSRRPDVVIAYAKAAMACREPQAASKMLRELLNRQWEESAVLTFGDLEPEEPLEALETAEKWLRKHPEDPALLLTCARLCMRAELYGKARSYLEASALIRPRAETLQTLATLLDQLGDRDRAFRAMSEALVLAIGRKPNLPRVRALRLLERRHSSDRRHS
jgi:HemY protein